MRHAGSQASIRDLIDPFKNFKVCVVGETIQDNFIHAKPISAPQSYPYIVAEKTSEERFIGGIFPLARDIATFVKHVTLVTNSLPKNALELDAVNIEIKSFPGTEISKTRFGGNQNSSPYYFLCEWPAEEAWASCNMQLEIWLEERLADFDVVICIDYGHGLISSEAASIISTNSRNLALNCQANGGKHPFHQIWKYPSWEIVSVNEYEARLSLGRFEARSQGMLAKAISERGNGKYSIVTDAERGAWIAHNNSLHHQKSLCSNIIDTIGCGDFLLAFSALSMTAHMNASQILYIGSVAAAAKARMRVHERLITVQELINAEIAAF